MRILHCADLHLGRCLHGQVLIEDQSYVLDQIVTLAREIAPDVILVAGDVYDRAVPPAEAVALLDDCTFTGATLERLRACCADAGLVVAREAVLLDGRLHS